MSKSRLIICFLPVCPLLIATGPVPGQTFPTKAIRIIASEAGAGTDFVARIVAQGLTAA
jgi:tripartite-type tricarboxylate transporter receptor subunit TctC